jgi:hypothetical protein
MEWKEITPDNEEYVYSLEDKGIPVLYALVIREDEGERLYYSDHFVTSIHCMAKYGGYYFYEVTPLKLKKA